MLSSLVRTFQGFPLLLTMRLVRLTAVFLFAGASLSASAQTASRAAEARARREAAAFEALRGSAGDSRSQVRLAELYLRGRGTPRDTVAAIDALGRAVAADDAGSRPALARLRQVVRRFRVVSRQDVAPGLVMVTTSVPVLPTYWAGSACVANGGRVLGSGGGSPTWRIDRIVLEHDGTALVLDTSCMGQDWPVTDSGGFVTYSMGEGADVATTAAGWIMGSFSDGAASYIAGWDVATGARLPFRD